jgi:DNA repair protein RecN (Recombination protein N)
VLERLTIRNFAIIDALEICWQPGLTVITGETGAGKSIVIDAVGALLGDRLGPEVVRSGAERATVDGVFVLPAETPADLTALLDEYGLEPEDGALIVTREIALAGSRGGGRINGRVVPLAAVQQLGEGLVDIHGQSEHMALLRAAEQLEYLDRYASTHDERGSVTGLVRELRGVRDAQRRLDDDERTAARDQEILHHQIAEIDAAQVYPGEDEELVATRTRLEHVERLRAAAVAAHAALAGSEGIERDAQGAVELLGLAVSACADGGRFDAALGGELLENLNSALALSEDAARSLSDYLGGIESDPATLEGVQERLLLISDLKRKYGGDIAEVLEYATAARARLDRYERRAEEQAELEVRERQLREDLGRAAAQLSKRRSDAAQRLATAVEQELADLRMAETRFRVAITQKDTADETGVDRVDFLVAANPGDEPRAMARVASGGELARIALALKTILSRADTRATLIFDEVDEGIGGRTAPVVGEKLWAVANSGHQVLCVTHMPQVAAYADSHLVVTKVTDSERPQTSVTSLDRAGREAELAAMLAGSDSSASRASARELLARAEAFKQRH